LALRVFQLAKEIGVKSASIVAKCQAEGLDIKNHMSTLSVGLGETIREWFSEGEHSTTIETTERVDLTKVKKKAKRKTKKKSDEGDEVGKGETAVAVIDAPVEPAAEESTETEAKTKKKKTAKKAAQPEGASSEKESAETVENAADDEAGGEAGREEETVAPSKKAAKKKVKPPEPFVPKPAQLQGPQVVRVERADEVAPPPSRVASRPPAGPNETLAIGSKAPTPNEGRRGGRSKSLDDDQTRSVKKSKGRGTRLRGRQGQETQGSGGKWGDRDLQERQERLAKASGTMLHRRERRLAQDESGTGEKGTSGPPIPIEKAAVKEPITVKELTSAIGVRSGEIMGKLMGMGIMATINQSIETEAAEMIALEFGVELTVEAKVMLLDKLREAFDEGTPEDELELRPPIVTFLGHVDHGKTSLLDSIRKSSVVTGEAGGITQHIGSYLYDDGKRKVAFLDTPGHKAFTAMRARGATMTDIVVLVVAADDGVMPQTEEAISHAKAAEVPIVVALNKMDLPNADENRVLGQLAEKELVPTAWGGDVEVVKTSAETGDGINELVEYLDYVSELNQLKAKATGPATGWVVESEMTQGQGVVARFLVKSGSLKPGDIIVSGGSYGRVRTISDAAGQSLKNAGPATPVEMTGLDEVPVAGDRFFVVDSMSQAKEIADEQRAQHREKTLAQRRQVTLENLFTEIKAGEVRELNVVIKADMQGSVDVLTKSIMELNTSEVAVRVLHAAVGGISESDILLAEASNAIIIGFQVVADEHSRALSEREGVEVRLYRVIYQIMDDIKKALEGMLKPNIEEKSLGRAEVRQVFKVSRLGSIAGCSVSDGMIHRNAKMRLIRDGIVLRDNMSIESLRRLKDDATEVRKGLECGIKLAGFDDLKEGDSLEAYENVEISRTLESVE
jgi:translation initiation factor IF-2